MGRGSETKGKFYGQRKHGAYGIYHFCFSFSNLFPIKSHSPIAKDRQINAVKAVRVAFVSLACSQLQWRCPGLKQWDLSWALQAAGGTPWQSLPSCCFAGAWTNSSQIHSWVQGFTFSCILPLAWCTALGKLLNLAKTLLFPLQSGVNSGHPSPLPLRCWDEKCCRDSRY